MRNKITAENIYDIEDFGYIAVVRERFRTADFTVTNDKILLKAASKKPSLGVRKLCW